MVVNRPVDFLQKIQINLKTELDKYNQKPPRTKESAPLATIVTCVKADKISPSGMIFKIRKELQDVQAYSIAYAVKAKD